MAYVIVKLFVAHNSGRSYLVLKTVVNVRLHINIDMCDFPCSLELITFRLYNFFFDIDKVSKQKAQILIEHSAT